MLCVLLAACAAAPNIVFLSVDTLRADRLGCYGYPLDTSPNLDAFAQEGRLFEDCVCEVPLTAPSFGSMLSSRFPRSTGQTRNGLRMPETVPLVTERFREAGYQTFCVQSNWSLKAHLSGLDRGFDQFDDNLAMKRWGVLKPERYGDRVTDIALRLLESRDPSRPLFCWIHYSDPHAPYRFHHKFNPGGKALWRMDRVNRTRAEYDSEVAYADHHIGRLLDALPKENTYVLFVADHGESLYEHEYLGHGRRIFQTGLHIPLIIKGPGIMPGRTEAPVRGVDVGPTLLALAGLPALPAMEGQNVLESPPASNRARVMETYGGAVLQIPGVRGMMADSPPMRRGVILGDSKLILGELAGPQLFDVKNDPGESTNLISREPERYERLQALIEQWDGAHEPGDVDEAALSSDDLEALETLGYLGD